MELRRADIEFESSAVEDLPVDIDGWEGAGEFYPIRIRQAGVDAENCGVRIESAHAGIDAKRDRIELRRVRGEFRGGADGVATRAGSGRADASKACHSERSEEPLTIFFLLNAPEEENDQRCFASLNMTGLFQTEPLPSVENLPRIQDAVRIERVLELFHQRETRAADRGGEKCFLRQSDAVFAGNRPAECERVVENFVHRAFHARHLVGVAFVGEESGMQISIAHVAEGADAQAVARPHFLDETDHLREFAARHRRIFEESREVSA